MPLINAAYWSDYLQQTLQCYETGLLRQVAAHLAKPRNQWPVPELIERCVAVPANPALVDRRLKELDTDERRVLAFIGHSRQPRWNLGNLIELAVTCGHGDGLSVLMNLFQRGLLYPDLLAEKLPRLKDFESWLGHGGDGTLPVFAHPAVAARAIGEDLGLPRTWPSPKLPGPAESKAGGELGPGKATAGPVIYESDGLEWPLRLAVLWQQVLGAPLRRTAQGDLFKRDWERLLQNPLLNGAPTEGFAELPDTGFLAVALGEIEGLIETAENEWRAGTSAHLLGRRTGNNPVFLMVRFTPAEYLGRCSGPPRRPLPAG